MPAGNAAAVHSAMKKSKSKTKSLSNSKSFQSASTTAAFEEKYCADEHGQLSREHVRDMLYEHNQEQKVLEEELDFVMSGQATLDAATASAALRSWESYKREIDSIQKLFWKFDTERLGKIHKGQLAHVLLGMNFGKLLTEDVINKVMKGADQDGDGRISFREMRHALAIMKKIESQSVKPKLRESFEKSGSKSKSFQKSSTTSFYEEKYGADEKGQLSREQVRDMLYEHNREEKVLEDELSFFMRGRETLDASDVAFVLASWESYRREIVDIERQFWKYDPERTGKINKRQLRHMLVDMNFGRLVSDEDVNRVMKEADQDGDNLISKPEMKKALAIARQHCQAARRQQQCCTLQ